MLHKQYYVEKAKVDRLVARKNQKSDFYNGIYDRYQYPVLTREFAPVHWRYDLNEETNPYFEERLGINAVMNSGAIDSTENIIWWFVWKEMTGNPSLQWQRVTMASMASTSGIIRWFCRILVRRRPMYTICG